MASKQEGQPPISSFLERRKQQEEEFLNTVQEWFKSKFQKEDIPAKLGVILGLLDDGRGILVQGEVLVEREGRIRGEDWMFVRPGIGQEKITPHLLQDVRSDTETSASKLGISLEGMVDVGIITKTIEHAFDTQSPTFLELHEKGDGIRLVDSSPRSLDKNRQVPFISGTLEYYSCIQSQRGPLYYLLAYVNVNKVDFETLFPRVLFFVIFAMLKDKAPNP